ncbi:RNA polymerase sigma-70 factor [Mucilaginibacter rubeus]|uniref:RNA polymerase sigma-70 factor n=1 Tax=Mucilaginibacter rubeus TaxID=2027860 RepID=A0AAE6JE89_9SPHI|nr:MULTISPECIES: RNA polymerase sigma-70 factor [Mucilaginibacter]QEM04017.1 RNA polymerase sigma-70 factor [Mucilaginibacter rubeus]QEM16623.1 RNA polymerase sigma-70 factor [Mucilaginibacter gossypii]QTE46908.1 RNA polymerase sigma-70 factor [Mucilaginibacter rubeus]QTE53506.1 RNA polymerase sigma-70 factor [Mucilaginibacter rubeus]QTE58592.1 RNA polymerase sigma-70 factor [Mucilaginibacter rubeus]
MLTQTDHILDINSEQLIPLLLSGDEATFEKVYKHFIRPLHVYAISILRDEDTAKGMVQNVFMRLWERKERLNFTGSIKAYLYGAVYNECLNNLRHQKVKVNHLQHVLYMTKDKVDGGAGMELLDLKEKLQLALNDLPEKCRTVFQLSRFEDLKYQEIADELGISIKTVENHMGKALKTLRLKLVNYLPLIIWLISRAFNII